MQGPAYVRNNIVRANSTGRGDGAGIYFNSIRGGVEITDNLVVDNEANDHGGGIYIGSRSSASEIEVSYNIVINNFAYGRDAGVTVQDCRGGGIWLNGDAYIHHNTVAFNVAETPFVSPDGGAVCLENTSFNTRVEKNIIFMNEGGGVSTESSNGSPKHTAQLIENVIFGNTDNQISETPPGYNLHKVGNIFEDPIFCLESPQSRGELASNSPALLFKGGPIGALESPGCGPGTAVEPTTWGKVKRLFSSEDQ